MAKRNSNEVIRRYTSIPGVIDTLRQGQLALLDPRTWDDRNDRYFMELYRKQRKAAGLYALCAAKCAETYHHWRVFTGASDGACIVIRRQPLEEYLRGVDGPEIKSIRFQDVEYLTLQDARSLSPSDMDRLPFLKRVGFGDEDEYRIVVETNMEQQSAIFIDCPAEWIDRIYINPWLPERLAESVIETLQDLRGCSDLDIRRSSLIDSTTWRKAGDRVAEKTTHRAIRLRRTTKT